MNRLFYGDNLDVLRRDIAEESVDLIYLDPPFNSNRSYNVLFKAKSSAEANAQIQAFDDTWTWSQDDSDLLEELTAHAPPQASEGLAAMHRLLGPSDMLSYLVMMTARLLELRRVLKSTGTLYLHCDPGASHYLKVMLDAIFGPDQFGNELIWLYKYGGRSKNHFGRKHDVILRYTKSQKFTFNSDDPAVRVEHEPDSLEQNYRHVDEDGRRYREGTWKSGKKYRYYADEGRLRDDVISDIGSLHQADAERLGYPTQKPLRLLDLLIRASSNEGDVVLDPFCGCGTTVDAAQRLYREWVGIDITYLAIDLITKRLASTFGDEVAYTVLGTPLDVPSVERLFRDNPFDFERWAVGQVNGHPNEKQVGDRGIDGRVRFWATQGAMGEMVVSVKGGRQLNPGMVRDLVGVVHRQDAEMGLLITMAPPTKGMLDEARTAGNYVHQLTGNTFPKLQIITASDLLRGDRPKMPTAQNPYFLAQPAPSNQLTLGI